MRTLLALSLALGLAAAATAQSNDARVEAINGSNDNGITLDQIGTLNTVGEAAAAPGILLDDSDQNTVSVRQRGASNDGYVSGNGADRNLATIDQLGDDNTAEIWSWAQLGLGGDDNEALADQNGDDNAALVSIFGSSRNLAEIRQTGATNDARAWNWDDSNDNETFITQSGDGSFTESTMRFGSDRNTATYLQVGDLHTVNAWMQSDADRNQLDVEQRDLNHIADVRVLRGDRNLLDIDQRGDGSEAHVMVRGEGSDANDLAIDQRGDGHEAFIHIDNDGARNGAGPGDLGTFRIDQRNGAGAGGHLATVFVDGGDTNGVHIDQRGTGHVVDADLDFATADGLVISGDRNVVDVDQRGTGHAHSSSIAGDRNRVTVSQTN